MNRNPKGYIEPPPVGHQGRSYTHEALAVITHVGIHIYNRCLSHRDRDYVTMTVKVARWCDFAAIGVFHFATSRSFPWFRSHCFRYSGNGRWRENCTAMRKVLFATQGSDA